MYSRIPLLALALSLPLGVFSQAATTSAAAGLPSAIVPFSTLPACAQKCGSLFDVQGACSPPVMAVSTSCFCGDARLTGLRSSGSTVCSAAGCSAADLSSIQSWYSGVCGASVAPTTTAAGGAATGTTTAGAGNTAQPTATNGASSGSSNSGSTSSNTGNQTWLQSHWQYVVMIVVIFVGLAAIWIGGCLLRRRYKRKRDLQFEMRPPNAPWVGGNAARNNPYGDGIIDSGRGNKEMAGLYATPAESGILGKKEKKKWIVKERT